MEIFFVLAALMLFPLGEANIQKSALLHGEVSMTYSPSQKIDTIHSVTWRFNKNGKRVAILDNTKEPYYIYPSQFKDRLMEPNDLPVLTLTIKDLTMEDSGIYIIDVTDKNGDTDSSSFNVTVYEPVPHPSIKTDVYENTTERCNVTLHCIVPSSTSDFSYTWKPKQSKNEYQLYNNGSSLQISLRKESRDTEILCIVQNPADQKNVSIQVQDICLFTGGSAPGRHHNIIIITILIVILILAIILLLIIWKKYAKKKEPREKKNSELNYIEVITHQPEGNERIQMENDEYIGTPSTQKNKAETLYTTLQHPQPKYARQ